MNEQIKCPICNHFIKSNIKYCPLCGATIPQKSEEPVEDKKVIKPEQEIEKSIGKYSVVTGTLQKPVNPIPVKEESVAPVQKHFQPQEEFSVINDVQKNIQEDVQEEPKFVTPEIKKEKPVEGKSEIKTEPIVEKVVEKQPKREQPESIKEEIPVAKETQEEKYQPNSDHYYDDELPEVIAEIENKKREIILKTVGIVVAIGIITYALLTYI